MVRFWKELWNSFTVPWNLVEIPGGMRRSRMAASTWPAAWPREKPGFRLNEIVVAGNWPKWLMLDGRTCLPVFTMVSSGTHAPVDDRTYRRDRASGVR